VRHGLRAGIAYFGIVFLAGFVLGTLRVLVLAPALGPTAAVAAEIPVMLVIAWIACRRLVGRFAVPAGLAARSAMGASAFALLGLAEALLGSIAFGRPVATQIADLGTPQGALGLAGQVVFGLLPVLQRAQVGAR
jgi:hypothetical protein